MSARLAVLHVGAELHPLVKTGGLADVLGALPAALLAHGIDARVLLPGLPAIVQGVRALRTVIEFGPAFGAARASLRIGTLPGSEVAAYVIDAPWLYGRAGNPYLAPDGRDWPDNAQRFALLGWAAAQIGAGGLDPSWSPTVVHAHDWHAGLAPAWLAAHPGPRPRTLLTIHNLAFQGLFPLDTWRTLGLPASQANPEGFEFHRQLSFMKAGLASADRITTVSPRYAQEITTPAYGCGLEGLLARRRGALAGLLNGIDETAWNPATDALIAERYDAHDLGGKAACKRALQREMGLHEDPAAPLFVVVSRLTGQKGMDLVLGAMAAAIGDGAQLAMLGSGERALEEAFAALARAHPGRVAVRIGYDEPLAHRLVAGGDAILVPSRFEPCGLTQMYGLHYGTLPVVRRVGGLADTVTDASRAALEAGTATGVTFDEPFAGALLDAMRRAIGVLRDAPLRETLMRRGMAQPLSWTAASARYVALYRELVGAAAT